MNQLTRTRIRTAVETRRNDAKMGVKAKTRGVDGPHDANLNTRLKHLFKPWSELEVSSRGFAFPDHAADGGRFTLSLIPTDPYSVTCRNARLWYASVVRSLLENEGPPG